MNRTVKWLYAVAVCVLTVLPGSLQAQCGGTERWQVKVGIDTGVGNVDLTNPISISVQACRSVMIRDTCSRPSPRSRI